MKDNYAAFRKVLQGAGFMNARTILFTAVSFAVRLFSSITRQGENFLSANCRQLPAGAYYLRANGAGLQSVQKLIIQP